MRAKSNVLVSIHLQDVAAFLVDDAPSTAVTLIVLERENFFRIPWMVIDKIICEKSR